MKIGAGHIGMSLSQKILRQLPIAEPGRQIDGFKIDRKKLFNIKFQKRRLLLDEHVGAHTALVTAENSLNAIQDNNFEEGRCHEQIKIARRKLLRKRTDHDFHRLARQKRHGRTRVSPRGRSVCKLSSRRLRNFVHAPRTQNKLHRLALHVKHGFGSFGDKMSEQLASVIESITQEVKLASVLRNFLLRSSPRRGFFN